MMNVCLCPAPDQLQAFARGEIDSDEIDRHLEECPGCRRSVDTLAGGATSLLRCLRPLEDAPPEDPALASLAACARTMTWQTPRTFEERFGTRQVGEYDLAEPIARGGMGWVFKATHRRMKRTVALKTVAPALSGNSEAAARFQREVEVLARLSHPHIVAAHDAFDFQDSRFLVMEYVEGRSLAERVRAAGPLPVEEAMRDLLQAARGLAHAHAAGIVHRDVKPGNLLLDRDGTVKVLDLGLARLTLPDGPPPADPLTGGSIVMGTAAYMAPEQALDPRGADARADIYSLGCTLFFLLTGKPPFDDESVLGTLLAHRENATPSLRTARPDCPAALDTLFRCMLAKRPEDRPASMNEVIAELERIQSGKGAVRPARRRLLASMGLAAALLVGVSLALRPSNAVPGTVLLPKAPAEKDDGKTPRIDMVRIEAGKFFRGSPDDERDAPDDEKPRREIRISRPFLLGKFEVTQEQYEEIMGENPSNFRSGGRSGPMVKDIDTRKHPVESVSWANAVAFCNRLSEKHGLEPYYRIDKKTVTVRGGNGYRLPTEAEWEYACRAGSTTRWSSGNDARALDNFAWHAGNSNGRTQPVGTKKPNAWGLYDMHGNVPEWCWDRYDAGYYQKSPVIDPAGAGTGAARVYRGGGWNVLPDQTRAAVRTQLGVAYSVTTPVGIRLARDL